MPQSRAIVIFAILAFGYFLSTMMRGVTGTLAFDGGRAGRTLAYVKQLDRDTGRFTLLKTIEIGS